MILYAQVSCQGDREYNEDRVKICRKSGGYTFGLADGLGGHGHGDIAAELAVGAIASDRKEKEIKEVLEDYFDQAQKNVLDKKNQDRQYLNMMTTMVAMEVCHHQIGWGHIGDSRLYYFQDRKYVSHTLDHSVPQILASRGEIKESDIRHHPDRNRLLRSLGSEWDQKPQCVDRVIEQTGRQQFLLCSDGFWEYIEEREMEQILQNSLTPGQWVKKMEKVILKNGHGYDMDNYSAVAVWSKSK